MCRTRRSAGCATITLVENAVDVVARDSGPTTTSSALIGALDASAHSLDRCCTRARSRTNTIRRHRTFERTMIRGIGQQQSDTMIGQHDEAGRIERCAATIPKIYHGARRSRRKKKRASRETLLVPCKISRAAPPAFDLPRRGPNPLTHRSSFPERLPRETVSSRSLRKRPPLDLTGKPWRRSI